MQITVSSRKLRPILLGIMALIIAAGLAVEVLRPIYKLKRRSGIVPLLSLSYEQNVPTWYSAALLLTCALLLAVIAAGARALERAPAPAPAPAPAREELHVAHWWGLAAGFTYISLDEVVSFHEAASGLLTLSGVLYFSWVVPATALLLLLGLAYWKFLAHLPLPVRRRFLLCGGIYVAGAVGMELPLGYWTEREGNNNLGYALIDHVEEALEMLGVNLFLLALVDYLGAQGASVRFAKVQAGSASTPEPVAEGAAEPNP